MNFNDYQKRARVTAIYPRDLDIIYPALGLAGETGEVCEKIKKLIRTMPKHNSNKMGRFRISIMRENKELREGLELELGDVLWYVANLASDLNLSLEDIATKNIDKLRDRSRRDVLQGEGDDR